MSQLCCTFEIDHEDLKDVFVAEFSALGFEGFEVKEFQLLAYILEDKYNEEACAAVLEKYELIEKVELPKKEVLPAVNWNEEWEKHFDPVIIADKIRIYAPFHEKDDSFEYKILIEPKMAFGTGHHETTYQILKALLELDCQDKVIMDYGCGTAILAVMAEMRGASKIYAIDYDPIAIDNAKEIVAMNDMNNIQLAVGDKKDLEKDAYDILIANINKNVLKDSMSEMYAACRKDAILILSGILLEDIEEMIEWTGKYGFHLKSSGERGQWGMLVFSKH